MQTAVVHAQFELIHPFKDGNGRIGRILIPLFMYQKRLLSQPMFYISEYLESNREEYYDSLNAISSRRDWNNWIAFFFKAVSAQAKKNSQRVQAIMKLYDEMKSRIHELTRSQYALHTVDWLFSQPVFQNVKFINEAKVPRPTAQRIMKILKDNKILYELRPAQGRQSSILAFPQLIAIVQTPSRL